MAMNLVKAETGRELGTRPSRRLRRSGRVPAVVYGMGSEPLTVSVDRTDLRVALNTEAGLNALITLDVEGGRQLSIVKDLQRHPVRRDVLHVDFLRIDPDQEVEVDVPLILTGEAKKVTQASGMVDQVMHHLPVLAKPADIPVEVTADVSDLEVGSSLRVSDIDLPAGVTPAGDSDATFAVGLITRSTKEYLRQLKAEEEAAEALIVMGEAADDEEATEDEEES
ncbi:MAG: 50S ribosomal protein L25 [Acidimicrobiaceae bacterium]|nr:50S ribosomal protein L25 [Acidimicrobiaceae bacterium]MDE0517422.1 50S ribosomal protein L25 [Acidimicrobiaceae bacterium]MDE0657461.1 50S ribosomal protein L25 [Acidimicrobiaceae bacterium]MXZ96235.1 50S ribosomal protein L25 [Acidimicrobiaceae bacterium]MYF44292.1 50S ribosomal protein L25 [Acidimicrobiaceae bacterium]